MGMYINTNALVTSTSRTLGNDRAALGIAAQRLSTNHSFQPALDDPAGFKHDTVQISQTAQLMKKNALSLQTRSQSEPSQEGDLVQDRLQLEKERLLSSLQTQSSSYRTHISLLG